MSLVNRLIKEAKSDPEHLVINAGQVSAIAQHCIDIHNHRGHSKEQIIDLILAERFYFCRIPLKVVGFN